MGTPTKSWSVQGPEYDYLIKKLKMRRRCRNPNTLQEKDKETIKQLDREEHEYIIQKKWDRIKTKLTKASSGEENK